VCKKENFSMWHKRDCLLGKCLDCGVKLLWICPLEPTFEKLIKWKSIGYKVVGTTDEGNPRKASTLEYRETIPSELFDYLKSKF
jgi:hypothetical protein